MKKKRLAVVLCAAMMLSACGGASGSDQAADNKGQEADSKAKRRLREMENWSFLHMG